MPKYAKSFIGITILLLFAVCLFFALAPKNVQKIEYVEAEESVEYSTTLPSYNDYLTPDYAGYNYTESTTKNGNPVRLFNGTIMIIDVIWVNFQDFSAFSKNGEIVFLDFLNQISQFFWEDSCHTLTIKFNIYDYYYDGNAEDFGRQNYSFNTEYDFYEEAKANSIEKYYYGEADARMIMLSYKWSAKIGSFAWPHVWMTYGNDEPPLCMIATNKSVYIYCHEIYHLLGIKDLYSTIVKGENVDIMQSSTIKGSTTSAQNKLSLGWINESDYEDDRISGIENIYQNGTYTLKSPISPFGTIAYKFGVSKSEFFLVEQRILENEQYLIIQKINTDYNSNNNAKSLDEFYIYTYSNNHNSTLFKPNDYIGNDQIPFIYTDGTRANYFINNIQIDEIYQTISFDFYTSLGESLKNPIEALTIPQLTHNYYINVMDQYGNEISLSEVLLFNSETNSYEKVNQISVVYINYTPFYALLDTDNKYTKCKLIFTSYCLSSEKVVEFMTYTSHYFVVLEKNIIQLTGESYSNFICLIKDTFLSFFGK